jgi:uncharacterized protein with von Willebrand factor type A (vWA) domain
MSDEKINTVVDRDSLDDFVFEVMRDGSRMAEMCMDEQSAGIVQDAFTSFFSHDPKVRESAEGAQKEVVETFHALPEYQDLRACTQSDEISSTLGVMQFAPELIKQFAEAKKRQEEKNQGENAAGKPSGDADDKAAMRQALRKALKQAQEKADQWQDALSSWGVDPGELKRLPAEKRMALAEQMGASQKMKKISDLAGRFQNIVHSAAANVPVHGVDEIVDISISSDISKILPTEIVKLIEQPEVFYSDLLEGKLLTYNLKGTENLGRGPVIACLDISGSMSGAREEWSKAVVLSLMALAKKQNRGFGFIAFNSEVVSMKFWPKTSPITLEEKMTVASISSTGGTNFYAPIIAAFEMRAQEGSLKPADIVFITDGEDQMKDAQVQEILDLKKKEGVRLQSVAICERGFGEVSTSLLKTISDQMAVVNNLGNIEIVESLLSKAASGASPEERPYG